MAKVQWIRFVVGMFDGNSFKRIKRARIGGVLYRDKLTAIWFELLDLAGKSNSNGYLIDNNEMPYRSFEDIATMLDRDEEEIELCMQFFINERMIEIIDDVYCLTNFMKYQNHDGLEKIREQNRLRKQKQREKLKLLSGVSRDVTQSVTESHDIEKEIDIIDIDIIEKEKDKREKENVTDESQGDSTTPQQIVELYNSICKSFPSVKSLSEARKKTLRARLKVYTLDDFKELFERAETSSFLKGNNERKWQATFDWLIKDANMAKVLDGNYNDRQGNSSFDTNDFFNAALNASYGRGALEREVAERMESKDEPKTAADDPNLLERLKKLQKELQG